MTKQSELGYWFTHDDGVNGWYNEDSPLGVHFSRWAIVNNSNHLYEGCGQQRVNWVAQTTSKRIEYQPSIVNKYELAAVFGPYPITLKRNKRHFHCVWKIAGSIDDAAETCTLRVALANGRAAPGTGSAILDYVDVTTTSTSDAWLTASTTLLYNDDEPPHTYAIPSNRTTVDDAEIASVHAMYRIDVYVKCTNAGGGAIPTARIAGFELREFVGS